MGGRTSTIRRVCDVCGALVPPGRSGIVYPLFVGAWNVVHPDPDDQRRVLHTCSDTHSWDLGRQLGQRLTLLVRAARPRARRPRAQ
jgi:hypothetical protein